MQPEFLSAAFLSALFAIVLIDLVLAGDNALIIGLVARNLPKQTQRKVIFWGTFGAIAARGLVWIARKLLTPDPEAAGGHAAAAPAASFAAALRTIVVADAVMGVDNVLAIGGAATGSVLLILLGLAISVPIIVWGSHLVISLVDRFPSIILLGGAVLGWTAYSMIVREPLLAAWFADHPATKLVAAILVFSVSLAPWCTARLADERKPLVVLLPALLVWLLAFEVASSVWKIEVRYLSADDTGEYLFQAARWLGWLPLAAAFLWLREQVALRRRRPARG